MKINRDLVSYSLRNIVKRRTRSFLTILSIFIGIMAIFALISFGQGLSNYVDSISNQMGADKLIIMPKSSFGNPTLSNDKFTEDDVEFIRKIVGVKEATAMNLMSIQVQRRISDKPKYTYAISIPTDGPGFRMLSELMDIELEQGRLLTKGDISKVVVGWEYGQPNKIFAKPISVGDSIIINGKKVKVIGILQSFGNPSDDKQVYFTEEGLINVLGAKREYIQIIARSQPGEDPNLIADKVQERFRKYKHQDEGKETFTVQTFQDLIKSFGTILTILNAVLVLIALISVVVAAVNIMNTMYTAVLERTNEIGVMKAIGAQNKDILFIFVFEAGFLGLLGSAVGIILGWGVAELGRVIAAGAGFSMLKPVYPFWLILGCLIFGFLMGAISGLAPAIQASRHKPVESLRYE
ncbi:MAG: ABC transporter permease [Candidatus Woesearchaeota archaeon]